MSNRMICEECGAQILTATFKRTKGVCMPCYKKDQSADNGQIFISYRRGDVDQVGKIIKILKKKLTGGISIFFDVLDLESSLDWSDQLFVQLNKSHALLAMIGPAWCQSISKPREDDVLLREVEWALNNKRALLPILIGGVEMPSISQLPEGLRMLHRKQALRVGNDTLDIDASIFAKRIPSLITEYGDTYSAVHLSQNREEAKSPTYSGRWRSTITYPSREIVILDFRIRGHSMDIDGFFTRNSLGLKRSFKGELTYSVAKSGSLTVINGFNLRGFIDELGPFKFHIPLNDKTGDTYVGVTNEGLSIWTQHLEHIW